MSKPNAPQEESQAQIAGDDAVKQQSKKAGNAAPPEFAQYIDANADKFIDRLSRAVAIPSYVTSELPNASSKLFLTI